MGDLAIHYIIIIILYNIENSKFLINYPSFIEMTCSVHVHALLNDLPFI